MKDRKKIILRIIILVIMIMGMNIVVSNAAFHSTDPKVEAGSTVSITLTSTEALQNYDIDVANNGGLQFVSVSTTGAHNGTKVSGASLNGEKNLATYTFKAPEKAGTYKVSFNINGVTNNSVVTVTEPKANENNSNENTNEEQKLQSNETEPNSTETKKSNNANLSDFGIKPNDFRGFKAGTLNYNTTVPNDVEQVTVYAKLQDQKAKITSGTGAQKLNVGENKLSVVVTAEDGTTKTYTVNVTREEAKNEENTTQNQTETEVVTNQNEEADLIKLEVEGQNLNPAFSPSVYEYKLEVPGDLKDLNIITEGANHNVSIELVGNTDLQEGENVVTVLVYNQETKKNTTYQILVNKVNANTEDMNNAMNDAIKKANFIRKILIGIFAFVVVAILSFIIIRRKYYYDDYEYEDYKFEEKLNLDDEEELFNRVNKDVFRKTPKNNDTEYSNEKHNTIEKSKEEKTTKEDIDTIKARKKGKHF